MTKQEIAKYIKDNLTISLEINYSMSDSDSSTIAIELKLDGEIVSEDSVAL